MGNDESLVSAPPPPPEVKVRTMKSDLAAMTASGGGLPQFSKVKVEGWAPAAAAAPRGRRSLTLALIIAAAAAAAAIVGYFIYASFFRGAPAPAAPASQSGNGPAAAAPAAPPASSSSSSASSSAPQAEAPVSPAGPFKHISLFTRSTDESLPLTLSVGGAASTAADLLTFNQQLEAALADAKQGASFIEIDAEDANGNGIPFYEMLAQENAAVFDPSFLAAHFSPDATFFVYRDANGVWPGYVAALLPGASSSSASAGVGAMEVSPEIANFFLTDVGAPAAGGFTDSTVSGTAVRVLAYPGANPPAAFVYGWFGNDLILSASRGGFAAALAHLH